MKYFFACLLLLCLGLVGCNKGPNTDCPICGRPTLSASLTCQTCIKKRRNFIGGTNAQPLIIDPDTGEPIAPPSWVCFQCGSKHGKPAARCPKCGKPRLDMDKIRRELPENRKKEQEPVPKVRRVRMDPYTGEPIDSLWVCIDCGYRDDTIHTECPNCGVPDQSNFIPLMPGK